MREGKVTKYEYSLGTKEDQDVRSRLPLYVSLEELEGTYVSHFPAGMQEILLKINHESGYLGHQARRGFVCP